MSHLKINQPAPDFKAVAVGGGYGEGTEVTLNQFRGQPVVLYFYPKDDTPGCTVQACALRDSWTELKEEAAIFGISVDSAKSHRKFIDKHTLPFPILVDEDHSIVVAYGVWVEKSMYGKRFMGTERSTFLIGPDGDIAAILERVKPADHVSLLREALASL